MRRIVLFLTMGALLLTMVPTVALAAEITCGTRSDRSNDPVICVGTDNSDTIREREGSKRDEIRAKDGDDTIRATRAGNDEDKIQAGDGDDKVFTNDGDRRDVINCGPGTDEATIDVVRDESGAITAADKVENCEKVFEIVEGEPVDITEEVEEFQNPTATPVVTT